ncbi:uncharacterized protein N0V96_010837 [Colletotrichum fioriniae]|uniref:uncharacterized protein n=1 Tax=Colletotrichum fioriniae TaxID=710243 RepID=UPI0032DA8C2A|nr:hypothetical protein N0V96_010837 [Colletotrichum fioriniae]
MTLPLDADGNEINMWAAGSKKKDEESSEEDSEEDSEEESDSDEGGAAQAELSRADRKAAAKARKDAAIAKKKAQAVEVGDLPPTDSEEESSDDDMPANPNHFQGLSQPDQGACPQRRGRRGRRGRQEADRGQQPQGAREHGGRASQGEIPQVARGRQDGRGQGRPGAVETHS